MSKKEIELLRNLCRKRDVSFMLAKTIFDEYYPLLDSAHRAMGESFDREFWLNREKDELKERNSFRLILILRKLKAMTRAFSREEVAAISLHTEHYAASEGLLNATLGFLIWAIINNGIPFNMGRNSIDTYEKISNTTFGQKIRFLKDHGLFEVITDGVTAVSRNNVGHLTYEITPTGEIFFDGDKVDYETTYRWIREVGYSLNLVTVVYYDKYRPK